MDMKQAIQRVADRQDLTGEEAGEVMELLLTGAATQAQIGAFLTGLRMKGETIDEIAGLASVLADKEYQSKIAEALTAGVEDYLNNNSQQ